jgi:hypothetical protein
VGVAGATVEVTGFWPQFPATGAAAPPRLFALSAPLSVSRPAAVSTMRRRQSAPVPLGDKRLLTIADAGATELLLSNPENVAVGNLLEIDADDPERREWIVISATNGVQANDLPFTAVLSRPLARPHAAGVRVTARQPGAASAANAIDRPALAGDGTLFPATTSALTDGDVAEIRTPGEPNEFVQILAYRAVTDAHGAYRLPPLHRTAQVTIRATEGAGAQTQTRAPNYDLYENRLDFLLP